jgi:hypothetical protein
LFDLDRSDFDQNRLQVGVAIPLAGQSRLDLSYMLRSRQTPTGWEHDHIVSLGLVLVHAWPTRHR